MDMRRGMMLAWLCGLLGAMPSSAQELALPRAAPISSPYSPIGSPYSQLGPIQETAPAFPAQASIPVQPGPVSIPVQSGQASIPIQPGPVSIPVEPVPVSIPAEPGLAQELPSQPPAWHSVWGLADIRIIPDGPKIAPNGQEYHPNFTMDLDFNAWVWRSQRLYAYADISLWGEKSEYGVTNANDGWWGTSKREFDLSGGAAWNYAGAWEVRGFGYTDNNLNRGTNLVTPVGFTDGFGLENRYYLSPEYAKLGQTGFDVSRADFVSVGYYPTKDMVGNDGKAFEPGLMLRAYLTYDLWNWPCYLFGDATYIGERSFQSKLLLFDVGLAARPFRSCQQVEFRLGVDNTADVLVRDVQNLWYVSFRYIF